MMRSTLPAGSTDTSRAPGTADVLVGIENILAGVGSDVLVGDGLANQLQGNGGADTLTGGGGKSGSARRRATIVLVDEMDLLVNKSQVGRLHECVM